MPRINVAVIACFDTRLLDAQCDAVRDEGGGFLIRMAGGGLAVLTSRDSESAIGQLTDAYAVTPFERFIVRNHLTCKKMGFLCAEGGEFHGHEDPTSVEDLYRLADAAVGRIRRGLFETHGVVIHGTAEVYDVATDDHGKSTAVLAPRPAKSRSHNEGALARL